MSGPRFQRLTELAGSAWSSVSCVYPTGSAYCCPAIEPADYDYIVLTRDFEGTLTDFLDNGWECPKDGAGYPVTDGGWCALRNGDYNVMLTADEVWYTRYCAATELCRALNVESKQDRIDLHRMTREGTFVESVLNGDRLVYLPSFPPGEW